MDQLSFFLAASMRMAIPLLIAALGLIISERAGIMNIGVEGIMLIGAFAAYTLAKITGSYWLGLVAAMLAGTIMIAIFAISIVTFKAEMVVVGAGMNLLCAGLSAFLYRKVFFNSELMAGGVTVETFPPIKIPLLGDIPLLGNMFFNHNIIVYFGLLMVIVIWVVLYKTSLGTKVIAVGAHPKAATSVGINVNWVQYGAILFSGLMIGAAGAYLSIAQSSAFAEGMTSGKGFIALAVVILGKRKPLGVLGGALIFGAASAIQMTLQNMGVAIPNNIIMMIPYIVTVVVVVIVGKNKLKA